MSVFWFWFLTMGKLKAQQVAVVFEAPQTSVWAFATWTN